MMWEHFYLLYNFRRPCTMTVDQCMPSNMFVYITPKEVSALHFMY